jgi:gluconate 2-dehydrogenase subunit 3-like protein
MSDETGERGFSEDEEHTLASVLDELIPPSDDGKLPGAGEIGLARYIAQALEKTPMLRPMLVQGLADVEDLARNRYGKRFAALSKPEKVAVLNEQGFLFPLLLHTYAGYYQNARVLEGMGLEARPPHPQGHQMEPDDLTLLDGVRRRRKLYRDC